MNRSSQFVILRRDRERDAALRVALVLAWALTLLATAALAGGWLAPEPAATGVSGLSLEQAQQQLQHARSELKRLRQSQATLRRSDQISRAANRRIQDQLAARGKQIAELRADLAFYERLAGATDAPKGLTVHSAEFIPQPGGTWRYRIVLTQSLERDAISEGRLQFAVEGVRDGQLTTVDWDDLHQQPEAVPQRYSFRYFQQLRGRVILPAGFVPQRVRVSLQGEDVSLDQALAWRQPSATGDT